jgi:hypothetical protein
MDRNKKMIFDKINMQYNPELMHLLKKETIILTQIKRFNFSREERLKKCRLVSFDQELHVVAPDEIKPGDKVIDVAALDNGYQDVLRECTDQEDADYLNSVRGLYQKQIASPFDIGAVIIEGSVNHDHVLVHGEGYTIESIHPRGIEDILNDGGDCYILMDEDKECMEPKKFVGRVLIISPEQIAGLDKK